MTNTTKYNLTIAPLWVQKSGNMFSIAITPEIFDSLQKVEVGGKLFVKHLPKERRKSDTSPHAYLEFVSIDDVKKYEDSKNNAI